MSDERLDSVDIRPDQEKLYSALLAAYPLIWLPGRSGIGWAKACHSANRDTIRAKLAVIESAPKSDVRDYILDQKQSALEQYAIAAEQSRMRCCQDYLSHFDDVGIAPADVRKYLMKERQILASLYFLAKEAVPSPTARRRLVLRLAIDARREISGNVDRFVPKPTNDDWVIYEYVDWPAVKLGLPYVKLHRIRRPIATAVLDQTSSEPWNPSPLIEYIESVFNGPPLQPDTLAAASPIRFEYAEDQDAVRLWIDDREVTGIDGHDVQALLRFFVRNPKKRMTGHELQRISDVKNASQAAADLKAALGDAGDWFLTKKLRWADGKAPTKRRSCTR